MKYLLLDGFPRGLDARKFNLSAPPGTLVELVNGHLTNGGEIEKRKAFVSYAVVTTTETGAQATAGVRTFGMQETGVGLTVFGSALPYGTSPTLSQPVLAAAMPTGVTYQQLKHPAVTDGVTYDKTKHAMTGVSASCVYGGRIAALATFADGTAFGYYDGALIRDFTDGLRMAHLDTTVKLATALTEMVNRSDDYTAVQLANPNDHKVNITGQPAVVYDLTARVVSSAGTLSVVKTSDPTPATSGSAAVGSFTIVAGGTDTVTKATTNRARTSNVATLTIGTHAFIVGTRVNVAGLGGTGYNGSNLILTAVGATTISYANTGGDEGTTPDTGGTVTIQNQVVKVEVNGVAITNAAIPWTTSNENTARLVADNINTYASTPDYTATANGAVVLLTAALSEGDTPNSFVVRTTCAGDVCVGRSRFQVIATSGFTNAVCWANGTNISGTVNYSASPATTAGLIAAAINDTFSTNGYVASAQGAVLTVSKGVTASDDAPIPIYFVVTGNNAANDIIEVDSGGGSASGLAVSVAVTGESDAWGNIAGYRRHTWYLSLSITGGVIPYQEAVWFGGAVARIDATHFSVSKLYYNTGSGSWGLVPAVYCTVRDATNTQATSNTL